MSQRLKDNIAIILFWIIISFTFVMATAGMLNTERILDYRIEMARQEMEVYRGQR